MPQLRRAVQNRCVFNARLKALSDRSGDRSAVRRTNYRTYAQFGALNRSIKIRSPFNYLQVGIKKREKITAHSKNVTFDFDA